MIVDRFDVANIEELELSDWLTIHSLVLKVLEDYPKDQGKDLHHAKQFG
jgi:hypothetical protein